MEIELVHRPGNSAARMRLAPTETVTAEAGAMICMSGDIGITTSTHQRGGGGILKGLKRMLGGESFFMNHYTAGQAGGEVWVAADLPGDMEVVELQEGHGLIVQSGSFVAAEPDVDMDMSWQGFGKAFFSGEAMFWLRMSGRGKVVLSSFGAIYPIQVDGEYIVDTGHIVAFDETIDFTISKAGKSWIKSFLGGEGMVCRFKGKGTVWSQSHNPPSFGKELGSLLPER
jgi:uncharacterized protein (TIGR00266 family)